MAAQAASPVANVGDMIGMARAEVRRHRKLADQWAAVAEGRAAAPSDTVSSSSSPRRRNSSSKKVSPKRASGRVKLPPPASRARAQELAAKHSKLATEWEDRVVQIQQHVALGALPDPAVVAGRKRRRPSAAGRIGQMVGRNPRKAVATAVALALAAGAIHNRDAIGREVALRRLSGRRIRQASREPGALATAADMAPAPPRRKRKSGASKSKKTVRWSDTLTTAIPAKSIPPPRSTATPAAEASPTLKKSKAASEFEKMVAVLSKLDPVAREEALAQASPAFRRRFAKRGGA